MFGKKKEEEVVKMTNYGITKEILESVEKYATKTIADLVSAAGGVTLDDLDPSMAPFLQSSLDYWNQMKEQSLNYALRQDAKELELDRKLEKQKMLLEEQNMMLKELLKRK